MNSEQLRLEYRPINLTNSASTILQAFRNNVTSQMGEDGVIAKIFELIGTANKQCVEFGAWDGKHFSNTWALINDAGWSGVLIEGDKARYQDLVAAYSNNVRVKPVNRYVGFGDDSIDHILRQMECPPDVDLMSIDIDGMDWYIFESLQIYRPRLIVIEFNPTIPNDVVFVQAPNPRINQGCSLLALIELGKRKGYELAATTAWNAFFVPSDLLPKIGVVDNSINAIHDCSAYETKLFQLFDGTIVIAGNTKLLWHGIQIHPWIIQPLPKRLRRFPPKHYPPNSLSARFRNRLARLVREYL